MVKVMMSYPDAMRSELDRRGVEWWAKGGEYESFSEAIGVAREVAAARNFPIQLKCMGNKMTVYPESLKSKGY